MIIDTGSKAFWMGALFFVLICDAVVNVMVGVTKTKREDTYGLATALDGVIMLVISVGWWFGV